MRILYFADVRFPIERANGIQTFETCYGLAARGHAVKLVVRADTARPPRDPFAFYGRAPHPNLRIDMAPGAPGALRRARYLAFAVAHAARRASYDVVFTRDLGVAATLLRLPRGIRPPVVYESHGYAPEVRRALPSLLAAAPPPSDGKLAELARRERRTWERARGYVTITRALCEELSKRFGSREHVAVVPDGVRIDPARTFVPRVRPASPVVTYAGHLYPWKGVDVFVEALARLPGIHGRIVGGHPAEPDVARVRAAIEARGIGPRMTMTGMVPPTAVRGYLEDSDVLVLPNPRTLISERYTSPLKLFEYMAAGRPIVVSNLPALAEIVRHGDTAWLVEPGDPSKLAAGIDAVLETPGLAERLATRAFTAAAAYAWEQRAERLERLLRAVVPEAARS